MKQVYKKRPSSSSNQEEKNMTLYDNGVSLYPDLFILYTAGKLSESFVIPKDYNKYHPNPLPKTAVLWMQEGRIWNVKWTKSEQDSTFSFQDGWNKFVKDNNLKDKDVIHMSYDGDRSFGIRIYQYRVVKKTNDSVAIQEIQGSNMKFSAKCMNKGILQPCISTFISMVKIYGGLDLMVKDEFGCSFLRNFIDRGIFGFGDANCIFWQVFHHFIQLATDPLGNFFVHKFLDVCNEEEKTQILLTLTSKPRRLVKISVNTYGSCVVHRLIKSLRTKDQMMRLVQSALNPGFLSLVRDINGYHVIQRFLRPLNHSFIIEAATRLCTEIATHRHGCCVLQRCVSYSVGAYREKLLAAISRNCLLLAQEDILQV